MVMLDLFLILLTSRAEHSLYFVYHRMRTICSENHQPRVQAQNRTPNALDSCLRREDETKFFELLLNFLLVLLPTAAQITGNKDQQDRETQPPALRRTQGLLLFSAFAGGFFLFHLKAF